MPPLSGHQRLAGPPISNFLRSTPSFAMSVSAPISHSLRVLLVSLHASSSHCKDSLSYLVMIVELDAQKVAAHLNSVTCEWSNGEPVGAFSAHGVDNVGDKLSFNEADTGRVAQGLKKSGGASSCRLRCNHRRVRAARVSITSTVMLLGGLPHYSSVDAWTNACMYPVFALCGEILIRQ